MLPPAFAPYHPTASFDEMLDPAGAVRAPWAALVERLGGLSAEELRRRAERAGRQLAAEGAGHLAHDDATDAGRWQLDVLPIVVGAAEWATVSRGLRQRAELLGAVLDDLYGEQRLVTAGVIPAEVVLGHVGYSLAARIVHPLGRRLTTYAADLVRDGTGRLVVLRDHTDAPSGAGSALLHRSVLTRVLPASSRTTRTEAHGTWFASLRDALGELAPPERGSPRVVVLTPGPEHADFVEHSYLATHLGYNLTTAGDLAVRSGRLWLRGLSGLEPIDVVLRRLEDAVADPLEMSPLAGAADSGGVPALLQVARERTVGIANALGTALGGQLALHPYLAAACRTLLGQELQLPSVDTLWCGDPDQRAEVLGALDRFVVHDCDTVQPERSVFGDRLGAAEADTWRARIEERPHRYVAQRKLELASTPVLDGGTVRPGTVVWRAHVTIGGAGAVVLPGGSAHVVSPHEPVLNQTSGVRKDVWVVADQRERVALARQPLMPQVDFRESVPSRAAEALFWLGRNAEHLEGAARLALAVLTRFEQEPSLGNEDDGLWLRHAVAGLRASSGTITTAVPTRPADASRWLLDELAGALGERSGAAGDTLTNLLSSARTVREFLSGSTWRVVTTLATERATLTAALDKGELFVVADSLDRTIVGLMALAGLSNESLVRGPGWRFLDIGRRLERAGQLLGLIEAMLASPAGPEPTAVMLETILVTCESLVAYRRRHRSDLELDAVWNLVVNDDTNPRSLAFQLDRIRDDLAGLPRRPELDGQEAMVAKAAGRLFDRPWLSGGLDRGTVEAVRAFVLDVRGIVLGLTDAISGTWFAHAYDPRRSGS